MHAPNEMTEYDWEAVFPGGHAEPDFRVAGSEHEPAESFTQEDVRIERSACYDPGGSGEPDFYALVELPGRSQWAALTAWHDYTGWD